MSDFRSIAAVTETLRQTLEDAIKEDLEGSLTSPLTSVKATTLRPIPDASQASNLPEIGVNIYLYSVGPNSSYRNSDLPTRRCKGELVQRPRAAIDLNYLLTFYGSDHLLEPQLLLGSVVRILNSKPLLTRKQIQQQKLNSTIEAVKLSDLADEIEQIRITPLMLSLEDLSKLWSVFFQTPYALSIAYQASVIFIEGTEKAQKALPVLEPLLYIDTLRRPVIEQVISIGRSEAVALPGDTLLVRGRQLRGDITMLKISGLEVLVEDASESEISLRLTSPPLPIGGLKAGVNSVQVVHSRLMGKPEILHRGFESNAVAIVLCPLIKESVGGYQISISSEAIVNNISSREIVVKVSPGVKRGQRAALMLNRIGASDSNQDYMFKGTFEIPDGQIETDTVTFHATGLKTGDYLVRIQIDGSESPLHRKSDPMDPVFVEPKISIQ
ncbi:MAG TPA: DUF4255 domain-containing protein [Methanotrichaceae archaeon]|nr:DUF4255 domain-containing protein [Methanotrichaceae archaeon]HQI91223.1 DUF4255 domain-containing protein [Methanotrichaceae archaeon]HQJ61729.1 DUF4255 domain-containing protein [Methanothrix soehngenii]